MARPEPACPRCSAPLRVTVRPGPSGAYRIGSVAVKCARCATVSTIAFRRVVPA